MRSRAGSGAVLPNVPEGYRKWRIGAKDRSKQIKGLPRHRAGGPPTAMARPLCGSDRTRTGKLFSIETVAALTLYPRHQSFTNEESPTVWSRWRFFCLPSGQGKRTRPHQEIMGQQPQMGPHPPTGLAGKANRN